jgi:hypothetical protein
MDLFLYVNCVVLILCSLEYYILYINRMLRNVRLPLLPGTSFKSNVSYYVFNIYFYILVKISCHNNIG